MKNLKKYWLMLKKSKTLMFGAALVFFGGLEMYMEFFQEFMSPKIFGLFSISVGMIVKILRFTTKSSLEDKIAEAMAQTEKK